MTEPRPFRVKLFLFRVLVGIFVAQFAILGFGAWKCAEVAERRDISVNLECPQIADKTETLFGVAIATVLSLLGISEKTR